jgi:hypothetical protein
LSGVTETTKIPKIVKIPSRSRKDLKKLAVDIVEKHVLTDQHLRNNMRLLHHVFIPLALGGLDNIDPNDVGLIYEYYDKSGPRSINGYPTFFSMYLLNKKDAEWTLKLVAQLQEQRQAFLEED